MSKELTFPQLIAFVKVAQLGHFGEAGRTLGRTQERVSQLVKELEVLLGGISIGK